MAARQLRTLGAQARRRIPAALDLLADQPRPPSATQLVGVAGEWRVRTGDYRIVYEIEDDRRGDPCWTGADVAVRVTRLTVRDGPSCRIMAARPRWPPGRAAPYPDSDKTASGEPMYWFALIVSGVLEAVWATALGRSEGLTRPGPSLVFAAAALASFAGLAYAMKGLPVGTAYAVWVGIGAALTAGFAMWSGDEPATVVRVLLLLGIVASVIGLKVTN